MDTNEKHDLTDDTHNNKKAWKYCQFSNIRLIAKNEWERLLRRHHNAKAYRCLSWQKRFIQRCATVN